MGLLIRSDGTEQEVKPEDGVKFTLEELYKLIGCEIVERIQISDKYDLIFDEVGKYATPLLKNVKATELAQHWVRVPGDESQPTPWKIATSDFIAGNCMLCETFFIDDEDGGSDYWR